MSAEAYVRVCRIHGRPCTITRTLDVRCPRRHPPRYWQRHCSRGYCWHEHLLIESEWDVVRIPGAKDLLAEYREILELASRAHPAMRGERFWELCAARGLEG
jgi:hypothetical protein